MTSQLLRTSLLACAIAVGAGTAQAAVLVDNAPDQIYGTNMSFALVADDFSLSGTYDLTGLRFWSLQSAASDYRGSVSWAIYADSTGPAALVASGSAAASGVATGALSGFGYVEYVYDISVDVELAAGTYWLALQNGVLGTSDSTEMIWGSSGSGGAPGVYKDFQLGTEPAWIASDFNHAFSIVGEPTPPVPEPGAFALLAAGLLAVGLMRRNRLSA